MPEPYVTDEAEEETRPEEFNQAFISDQPPLPEQPIAGPSPTPQTVPRRNPTLPVRFASPVTGSGDHSISRRRPFRGDSRDRPSPDKKRPEERAGRGGRSFLGEHGRQTSSPSPIRDPLATETSRERQNSSSSPDGRPSASETRRSRDEIAATSARERSLSPRVNIRDNKASNATYPEARASHYSEEDTVDLPNYFRRSRADEAEGLEYYNEEDIDIRIRRDLVDPPSSHYEPRHSASARPVRPRFAADYDDDEEVDVRTRDGRRPRTPFEPATRPRPVPSRSGSRYDSDDGLDIRARRGRESMRELERQYLLARKPTHEDYYEDDFYPRTAFLGDTYSAPRSYHRERYRSPRRRRSTTYDDEDEIDIRLERERNPYLVPSTYAVPRYSPYSPRPSNDFTPKISGRSRSRASPPPPAPIIINNRIYNESDDEDFVSSRTRRRIRSRSRTPPPPTAAAPVIINNRIYNDYDDDDVRYERENADIPKFGPPAYSRSRSRAQSRLKAPSVAPVLINNQIKDDYNHEDYDGLLCRLGEPDIGFVPEAYSFSLSRHSKNLPGTESIISSTSDVSDLSEKNGPDDGPSPKPKSESGRTYHVLQSRYVGDSVIGGSHAVQLNLIPDAVPQRNKGVAPVYRWVHFEDKNMDLDSFEYNTLNIPGLTDSETAAIAKILGRAKKGYDKPLQTSTKVKTRFMVPAFLQETVAVEKRPVASKARTISWLCIPYFCMEKYAAPSGLRTSSHPMRTLLQARFALVQKARDMQQAVCHLPNIPPEHCFHIAQVWFLILSDSLVVSCARLPMTSLQGDLISVIPNTQIQSSLNSSNILVSTKSSLLWSLPLEECQSWFGFVSHFRDYWPLQVEVKYNEKAVTASEWPRILALAKKTTVRLMVDFQRISTKSEPAKGRLLYEEGPREGSNLRSTDNDHRARKKTTDQPKDEFHVFTWLNSRNETRGASSGISAANVDYLLSGFESPGLEGDLAEIDIYLSKETSLNHRLTYNRCPSLVGDRSDIYDLIFKLKPDASSTEENIIARYETLIGVLNAAELLFMFFLPPDSQAPTTPKFWGAIFRFIQSMPTPSEAVSNRLTQVDRDLTEIFDWLRLIIKSTSSFKDYLSHVPWADRSDIPIPEELTTAWLHLVLAMTFSIRDIRLFDSQMTTCHDLIDLGIKKVISNVSKVELSNYAVFSPFEFASLIAFQLSRGDNGSAADISDAYLEYLKTLQSDIESNPLDRSHQDRIVCFKQEIEVISETLEAQQYILKQAQRGFGASRLGAREDAEYADARRPSPRTGGHILPSESTGVQSIIIQDNIALVENRIRGFSEMREIALELGDWNIQKIDSNKDRQEAAIYAFTIVTIIFLPLGTVAGIMGMNTSDVRDMSFGQWVYWATALPLTILVIAVCLAWAGELNNFQEGLKNMWKRHPRSHEVVKQQYEAVERRNRYDEMAFERPRRSNTMYGNKGSYV
ncbi:hypothetical protein BKA65DRAFT_562836 [Rhexocercosporidium sp. MPI-PUGE-AT-0058]|nr:hypothetical protein BKA65DRAFT_562836 [Rhexocercosporidium sp. MPI-PUGE-AT-0058]